MPAPYYIPDIVELIDLDAQVSGDEPAPELVERQLGYIVRKYPTGRQFEQALRDAIRAGWRARHVLSLIQEERSHG